MQTKRMIAYMIDLLLITSILMILFYILPSNLKTQKIQTKIDQIGEEYASGEMDKMTYFMTLSSLEKDLDQKQALEIVIDSVLIVIYFIIVPYIWNGFTVGKRVMNLKIVESENKKVHLMSLFMRAFIMDGLLASLLIIFGIYVIDESFYLSFVSILAILQLLSLIVSYFMIKYRRDLKGLDDILSHSKVVKINEGSEL